MTNIPNLSATYFHQKRTEAYDEILYFSEWVHSHFLVDTAFTGLLGDPMFQKQFQEKLHRLLSKSKWLSAEILSLISENHQLFHDASDNNSWSTMGFKITKLKAHLWNLFLRDVSKWTSIDQYINTLVIESDNEMSSF